MLLFFTFTILRVYGQGTTYYVDTSGTDDLTCGSEGSPCASINQVILNNPGSSYTVSIGNGSYDTSNIVLVNNAVVIFQGSGNTTITGSWRFDFIILDIGSGYEWRDVTLVLSDDGATFSILNTELNSAGFYNVIINYTTYSGEFVDVNGGSVTLNNVTFDGATSDAYFITDSSIEFATNISVSNSTFSNLNIQEDGGLIVFDASGTANIVIDNVLIYNISSAYVFIGVWGEDVTQQFSLTNSVFYNIYTAIPSVYVENDNGLVVAVTNVSWTNTTSEFVAGALEVLGTDDGVDHDILLNLLTFINCTGPYAGGLLIGYNTLTLSNSSFSGNIAEYGNDLLQGVDDQTDRFTYVITDSYSSSALPKAGVWDLYYGTVTDISDQLPDPSKIKADSAAPPSTPLPRPLPRTRTNLAAVKPKLHRSMKKNKKN